MPKPCPDPICAECHQPQYILFRNNLASGPVGATSEDLKQVLLPLLKHHLPLGKLLVYQSLSSKHHMIAGSHLREVVNFTCQLGVPNVRNFDLHKFNSASLLNSGSLLGVDLWPGNPKSFKALSCKVCTGHAQVCTSLPATILKLNFSFSSSQSAKGLSG